MANHEWPGRWHSKADTDSTSFTNDNGLLVLVGDDAEQYFWYDPEGYDPRTEVRP
jgi:hypothetical protein